MITVRNMTLDDLPLIDKVQRAAFIEELWEDMSLFQDVLEGYAKSSFVAHKDGALLGYLLTYPSVIERDDFEGGWRDLCGHEDYLYVHDLCVHPDGRGLGIANLLLKDLEKFAEKNGFRKFAGIAVQDSISFWLKHGFTALKPYPYHGEPGTLMVKEQQ